MNGFDKQFEWQNEYLPEVVNIFKLNVLQLIDVKIASKEQDTKYATDMVVEVKGGDIAVRIRNNDKYDYFNEYCDLTIRTRSMNGKRTEIDKLRDGFGSKYGSILVKDNIIVRNLYYHVFKKYTDVVFGKFLFK